ncbi:MAG: TrkH family potassium uptake protein [Planctomycetota bacterium]
MNFRLLSRLLGILCLLIGSFMLLSLPWASQRLGQHTDPSLAGIDVSFETDGFYGLLLSALIAWAVGGALYFPTRKAKGKLFRKEAIAVVGLSWILATVLGALPFVLSGTMRGPAIRTFDGPEQVMVVAPRLQFWNSWEPVESLQKDEFALLQSIADAGAKGLSQSDLREILDTADVDGLFDRLKENPSLGQWLVAPGEEADAPADRTSNYRVKWFRMGMVDAMFEAQSGFSTTGATVLCDLEDPMIVPHCILFWRASTHFLGGLGIIVLFVVLLGQGSAGKALMRTEVPGPTQDNSSAKMQHSAWLFAATYVGLVVVLAIIYKLLGMSFFDSLCHSFATMATGGFSTYNSSLGHFVNNLPGASSIAIEYVTILFMILAGTNFVLLMFALIGNPLKLIRDAEWRFYAGIICVVTLLICIFGAVLGDPDFDNTEPAFRNGLFQVVSIITTTGYGTCDFDSWNHFSRGMILALMFVGGCAGSTGGGIKVIRVLLFVKILGLEIEQAFRPKVVGLIRLAGKPLEDQSLRHTILVYVGLVVALFLAGWLFVLATEPNETWGFDSGNKLIDSSSAVISTLNNIGPGLGNVGATQNYSNYSSMNKVVFIWLMMLGRLEIFPILVLFAPGFWREH